MRRMRARRAVAFTPRTLRLGTHVLCKGGQHLLTVGGERVAELAVGLPPKWKVSGTQKKILLRDSQRGRLPDSILDGPKTGFGVPYEYWLRSSLFEFSRERLLDSSFLSRLSLDREMVEKTLSEHRSGNRDRGFLLWKLLNLQLWDSLRPTDSVVAHC